MTREIKFRVIKGNKIVGYEELREDGWYSMMLELNPENGERWGKFMFNFDGLKRCQYIGLKDKNGVEIYEGDVIQNVADNGTRLSKFEIVWDDMSCSFVKRRCCDGIIFHLEPSKFYERMGNIHQNPELLNP